MKTILVVTCLVLAGAYTSLAALDINSLNTAFTENFSALASSGTSSTLPTGWHISESLGNANTTYAAGTGSDNAGNTYSFGAAGSGERALGGLQSGSLIPTFGVEIKNNSGTQISGFEISYFGEQWRLGATGRPDRLDFQYSVNASGLTTGTWTDVNALDFLAPITAGTVGALNGNLAANRTSISGGITGLTVANGGTIWLRWNDFNATGSDDGLAIDDFSITAVPEPGEWGVISGLGLLVIFGLRTWRERKSSCVRI